MKSHINNRKISTLAKNLINEIISTNRSNKRRRLNANDAIAIRTMRARLTPPFQIGVFRKAERVNFSAFFHPRFSTLTLSRQGTIH